MGRLASPFTLAAAHGRVAWSYICFSARSRRLVRLESLTYFFIMEPIHAIEYELTSELATSIQRALLRFELRRGWRRDWPTFAAAGVFAALIVWLGMEGWLAPAVGSALLGLLTLFVIGAIWRRWALSRTAAYTAVLALYSSDRRVRLEFLDERIRMDTEYFRGEGAWTELEEVVVFPSFWMLRLANEGVIVIPSPVVSPELEGFIRAKAQLVMAPVRQANVAG